jgi:DNA helicase HerA-like ATPase
MQEIGTVISTLEGPSTRKFSFVINKDSVVRRGQYVQLRNHDGNLIGRVADVVKANKYFMRPDSVKEYESSGRSMDDLFPVDHWEYLVAEVNCLGVHTGNGFMDSSFPPSPGTRVVQPENHILSDLFGLDQNGLLIGTIPHHDVEVKLSPTRLLQKHLAILAISGAGKSFLTSVILEELMERKPEQGQLAVIVIDTHGEYASFADDPKYAGRVSVFPISDVQIGIGNLRSYQFSEFMPNLSYPQMRELLKVMDGLRKKNYNLSELIDAVESNEKIKPATKEPLLSNLMSLRMTGLFGVADYPSLEELVRQGSLSIIDLSETTNLNSKQMLVAYVARKLFNARKDGIIPPFLLILEEAHQFVPETTKKEHAISKGVMQTIAREGRKFNASLCLISQRPIQLSTTVLSQCNTHIILRITNPYDLDHIGKSSEGMNRSVLRQISSLKVGTGIIVGEAVNFPLFVKIRMRRSKASEKGLPLEKAAAEYYARVKQKKRDAKEFM